MPYSKDNKMAKSESPRRSLFATLFIPDIGASVRPLKDTFSVFVNFIALLFVLNGLFPRDHPAFQPGSKVKLHLLSVIRTAWDNVTFTKKTLFQTAFFFIVVGCMAFTTLLFLFGICSLFVGKAHAASLFTAPGGNQDLAQQFIAYLFQGQTFTTLDQNIGNGAFSPVGTSSTSNIIQCSLYTALGYYSNAILIVAAMVLFYHLAWMTVETAHHGVVMGQRGNQVWAPIRLVFAIGLLVPVGGGAVGCPNGSGAGLNAGQILVVGIAEWGSGLASNVWSQFVTVLSNQPDLYTAPSVPSAHKAIEDIVNMYACQYAYNFTLDSGQTSNSNGGYPNNGNSMDQTPFGAQVAQDLEICEPYGSVISNIAPDCPAKSPWVTQSNDPAASGSTLPATTTFVLGSFGPEYPNSMGVCGSYTIPAAPVLINSSFGNNSGGAQYEQSIVTAIYNAHTSAFQDALQQAYDAVTNASNGAILYYIPGSSLYGQTNQNADIITPIVDQYETSVENGIEAAVNGNGDVSTANVLNLYTNTGWIAAGAWFNRIAKVQTDITAAAQNGLPTTTPPNFSKVESTESDIQESELDTKYNNGKGTTLGMFAHVAFKLQDFDNWLTSIGAHAAPAPLASDKPDVVARKACDEQDLSAFMSDLTDKGMSPSKVIFWLMDHAAACNGVWRAVAPGGGNSMANLLGVEFTGANPLADVAAFGQANVNTAFSLIDWGFGSSIAGAFLSGATTDKQGETSGIFRSILHGAGGGLTALGGFLLIIAGMFFTMGFTIAYYLPLVPFISFFFGTLTWVVAMLEAVIAVPLIALAHLNPEGAGLPGDMARSAYFILFQLFLRPVLMVFGLLTGFLVFYIAVSALNALFGIAVGTTGDLSNAHFTAARIIYTIIYVLLIISAANNSFQLITRFPDTALSWMGTSGMQGAQMGSAQKLEQDMAAVQAIVINQAMPQLGSMSRGLGQGLGTKVNPGGDKPPTPPNTGGGRIGTQ